ncbi:hypothetical protein ACN98T_004334 [Klebsiella aerogenes]
MKLRNFETDTRFLLDTANHRLEIIRDDGLYRHLRMKQPGTVSLSDAVQPTLTSMNQEFNSEKACRAAFVKIKEVNNGELMLRGVCAPKGDVD